MTFDEVHRTNLRWSDGLRRLGVGPGVNVATMLPNSFEAYSAWLGLGWLRAIEVPVNTMHRGRMLSYILSNCDAEVLIVGRAYLDKLAEVADALPKMRTVVVPDADGVDATLPFEIVGRESFLRDAEPAADLDGPAHYDISCMIYTSGTTGPSKGVLVPWAELYNLALSIPEDALREGEAYYSCWAPSHVSGKASLYIPAIRNGKLVARDGFSVSEFWDDIRRFECRATGLFGPLAKLLLTLPPTPEDAENPLRGLTCAPLFPEVEEFKSRFGVAVATGYGMTEIGGPIVSDGWNLANWQSCGRVRPGPPGYEIRVVNEHDEPLGPDQVGELVLRADEPWVLNAGYYNMPDKTADAWRNGWFHTGDAFRFDADGNFYFVDRIKDAIRRRGENISSFEVEAYVLEHPDIADCGAVGIPSEFGEEEVKVCVVRKPGAELTEQKLVEFLIPRMPRFMVPRYIEFVDELPKTDVTARTKKAELRRDALNERTWDRERAGVEVPR